MESDENGCFEVYVLKETFAEIVFSLGLACVRRRPGHPLPSQERILRGTLGTRTPLPEFLHFHAFFGENWSNNRFDPLMAWRTPPPPREIPDPPLPRPNFHPFPCSFQKDAPHPPTGKSLKMKAGLLVYHKSEVSQTSVASCVSVHIHNVHTKGAPHSYLNGEVASCVEMSAPPGQLTIFRSLELSVCSKRI